MKAPVLGLYGEADQGIPVASVEAMKAALAAAGKTAEFKIYPGAPHGFHADYRPSYRKDDAEDAWAQLTAWFKNSSGVLSWKAREVANSEWRITGGVGGACQPPASSLFATHYSPLQNSPTALISRSRSSGRDRRWSPSLTSVSTTSSCANRDVSSTA